MAFSVDVEALLNEMNEANEDEESKVVKNKGDLFAETMEDLEAEEEEKTSDSPDPDVLSFKDLFGYEHKTIKGMKFRHYNNYDWPKEVAHLILDPDDYSFVEPNLDNLMTICIAIEENKPLLNVGFPGTGKDLMIEYAAAKLGIPYATTTGAEDMDKSDIVGMEKPRKGSMEWVNGPLTPIVEHGGIWVQQEPFMLRSSVTSDIYQSLLGRGILELPNHSDPTKHRIKAHPLFRMISTSNARGTGDNVDKYAATMIQDTSSLNRYKLFTTTDYMTPAQEKRMLKKSFPLLTDRLGGKMIQLANGIRTAWKEGQMELPYSARNLTEWAYQALRTKDLSASFNMTYGNMCNDIEKKAIRDLWNAIDFECKLK